MSKNNIAEGGCLPDDPNCGDTKDESSAGRTTTSVVPTPSSSASAPKRGVLSTVLTALGELDVTVMRNKDGVATEFSTEDGGRISVATGGSRKGRMNELERQRRNRQQNYNNERADRQAEMRQLEYERRIESDRKAETRAEEQLAFQKSREKRLADEAETNKKRRDAADERIDRRLADEELAYSKIDLSDQAQTGTQQLGFAYEALDAAVKSGNEDLVALSKMRIEQISTRQVTMPDGNTVPFYEVGIALASEVNTPAWGLAAKKVMLQNGATENQANEYVRGMQQGDMGYDDINNQSTGVGTALENAVNNSRHHSGNLAQYKQAAIEKTMRGEYRLLNSLEDEALAKLDAIKGKMSHATAMQDSLTYQKAYKELLDIQRAKGKAERKILNLPPSTVEEVIEGSSTVSKNSEPIASARAAAFSVEGSPEGYAASISGPTQVYQEVQQVLKEMEEWRKNERQTEAIPTQGTVATGDDLDVVTEESEALRKRTLNDFSYRYLTFMFDDPDLPFVPDEIKETLRRGKREGWWNLKKWERDQLVNSAMVVADEMVEEYQRHSNGADILDAQTQEAKKFYNDYIGPFNSEKRQPTSAEMGQMVARNLSPDFIPKPRRNPSQQSSRNRSETSAQRRRRQSSPPVDATTPSREDDQVPEFPRPAFLEDDDEREFLDWYKQTASKLGLNLDPDDLDHQYDYREFWEKEVKGRGVTFKKGDHFSSRYKLRGHPNRYVRQGNKMLDTITGKTVDDLSEPGDTN